LIISEFPLLEGHRSIDADIAIGGEGGVMTRRTPHGVQNSDGAKHKAQNLNCKFHESGYAMDEVNVR
jgi:hypothetical protein